MKEPQGIGVQAFYPDILEIPAGQWRFVRYEPCPLGPIKKKTCPDEHHHWGRGDHVVPVNPDWKIGDSA